MGGRLSGEKSGLALTLGPVCPREMGEPILASLGDGKLPLHFHRQDRDMVSCGAGAPSYSDLGDQGRRQSRPQPAAMH